MDIQAKICKILPMVSGTSERGEYCILPLVVSFSESVSTLDGQTFTRDHSVVVDYCGDNVKNAHFAVGQTIRFMPVFKAREWQGRYFQKVSTRYISIV